MTETTTAQTMAVLAELVLMATRHNLPMPLYLTASEKNSQLNLTLNNRADFEAWHAVFGGGRVWECEPTEASPTVLVTNMHSGSLLGWSVNVQANVPPPLSAEVLAALGEAARADAAVLVTETVAVLPEPCIEHSSDWWDGKPCKHCKAVDRKSVAEPVHELDKAWELAVGVYRSRCLCGWESGRCVSEEEAEWEITQHARRRRQSAERAS